MFSYSEGSNKFIVQSTPLKFTGILSESVTSILISVILSDETGKKKFFLAQK